MTMEFSHTSVLLKETIENLKIKPDGIYVDGTLGGAGHSSHICERLSATGRLIGIDQDEAAIAAAGKRLEPYQNQVTIIRSNYCDMVPRLAEIGVTGVDGILLDLEFHPISWIMQSVDSHTVRMFRWICGWIREMLFPRTKS